LETITCAAGELTWPPLPMLLRGGIFCAVRMRAWARF
jgi:hypothetical protein